MSHICHEAYIEDGEPSKTPASMFPWCGWSEAGHCFPLLFFYTFCFSPTSGILRELICMGPHIWPRGRYQKHPEGGEGCSILPIKNTKENIWWDILYLTSHMIIIYLVLYHLAGYSLSLNDYPLNFVCVLKTKGGYTFIYTLYFYTRLVLKLIRQYASCSSAAGLLSQDKDKIIGLK